MKNVLITGVNGFIGSHVAAHYLSRDYRVSGIVRKNSSRRLLAGMDINFICAEITDPQSLKGIMEGMDLVIHVAGLAADWGSWKDFYNVNVVGTQNIARAAAEAGIRRFVHISSAAIHGFGNRRKVNEQDPFAKTIFPYVETKKEAEIWLFSFAKQCAMEITAIRPGVVFGPKDHKFILKYLDALHQGKIGYVDKGMHPTCPCYIDNLVDVIYLAGMEQAAIGEAFLITDGIDINWKDFTDRFADALGFKRLALSLPFAIAYGAAFAMEILYKAFHSKTPPMLTRYRICNAGRDFSFSIEKAKRLLHYSPRVGMEEAVLKTVSWYRNEALIVPSAKNPGPH